MNMATFKPFLLLISLLGLALVSSSIPLPALAKGEIVETGRLAILFMDIKTLSEPNAGTTSNVSITLGDRNKNKYTIPNLVDWDLSRIWNPGHVYFRTGQLDKFVGLVYPNPFTSPPCFINITITATGRRPDWGLDYINITSTAPEIGKVKFYIAQWLKSYNNHNVPRTVCPPPNEGTMTGCTKTSLAI